MKSKISPICLSAIRIALRQYEDEVYKAGLSSQTTLTYLTHAKTFVRWLHGEFTPGSQKTKISLDKRTKLCETVKK